MTSEESVEGGLDEPTELEPEQGSLALAAPDDDHDRAEWEAAAAAVLRKAGRLGEDDADDLVWQKLARTTLDGLSVTPARHARPARRPDHRRSPDPRRRLGRPDPAGRPRAGAGRPRHRRDLAVGRRRRRPGGAARRRPARPGTGGARRHHPRPARELPRPADLRRPRRRHQPRRRRCRRAPRRDRRAGPRRPVCSRPSSTGPWSTTAVRPTCRSSVTRWPPRRRTSARSPGPGSPWSEAAGLLEFRLAATDDQFPTIAKFRAARRLWARMLELSGWRRTSRCGSTPSPAGR